MATATERGLRTVQRTCPVARSTVRGRPYWPTQASAPSAVGSAGPPDTVVPGTGTVHRTVGAGRGIRAAQFAGASRRLEQDYDPTAAGPQPHEGAHTFAQPALLAVAKSQRAHHPIVGATYAVSPSTTGVGARLLETPP
jgi:hypothetical protein